MADKGNSFNFDAAQMFKFTVTVDQNKDFKIKGKNIAQREF